MEETPKELKYVGITKPTMINRIIYLANNIRLYRAKFGEFGPPGQWIGHLSIELIVPEELGGIRLEDIDHFEVRDKETKVKVEEEIKRKADEIRTENPTLAEHLNSLKVIVEGEEIESSERLKELIYETSSELATVNY